LIDGSSLLCRTGKSGRNRPASRGSRLKPSRRFLQGLLSCHWQPINSADANLQSHVRSLSAQLVPDVCVERISLQGASLHAHEAGLNEAWDSDDSEYCAYLSTSLCAPASGAPTAAASEDARDAGSIMSSGGADKEDTRLEAFTSASESESGASTDIAAIVQDMLSINRDRHVKLMLRRTQTPPAERLALHSVSRLAARTMPACPTTALTRGEPTQKQKKLVAGSGSVVKRGCRKCAACHKYHHWNTKCNGLVLSQTPTKDSHPDGPGHR
jgi:hypothetical protein